MEMSVTIAYEINKLMARYGVSSESTRTENSLNNSFLTTPYLGSFHMTNLRCWKRGLSSGWTR
jgi:hypothetical protein